MVDEKGNVHLIVNKDEEEDEEGEYGDEEMMQMMGGDMDEEEFLAMMEQQDALARGPNGILLQNSTIINSSQNTSLEDQFAD